MAGHSKWANIRHRKGAQDSKRGKIFTKIIKEITVSARLGGGDQDSNPRLRKAVSNARSNNMPQDNIIRAIKKGTGELEGVKYEEMSYEGYGPNGIAIYIEVITDNKNRTVSEIRHILNKNNGSLAEPGSVSWMFERKGEIIISDYNGDEEKLFDDILESGAIDFERSSSNVFVTTNQSDLMSVKDRLEEKGYILKATDLVMAPKSTQEVNGEDQEKIINLMETIDNHDDVNQVYSNFSISSEN
ncbi:MAG: YebC/PmpR family DNA-binding transcriptional regulator [bacterium TMED217]|nr:MAG: YebC/PmpR family DNA-binding transcriptional regulator [bacterium TMED217]|tara:strand:- start:3063 stop:3794 length:732 start_codon:yes stop_codon:yes gene_type:complete